MLQTELFTHWTFDSFAPGSLPRAKYNAFRSIHGMTSHCFAVMAQIQDVEFGHRHVDWARVVAHTAELSACIRTLIDQLQIMNPVQFMDVHDWAAKIGFYARLATSLESVSATPPYVEPFDLADSRHGLPLAPRSGLKAVPSVVLQPSLFQYFVELNDLRPRLDAILQKIDLDASVEAEAHSRALREIVHSGVLPARLYTELDIAAVDLAPRGGTVDAWVIVGSGAEAFMAEEYRGLRAADFADIWVEAASRKYAIAALHARLCRGLADEEDPVTIVAVPSGAGQWTGGRASSCENTAALLRRLESVAPHVTKLHAFERHGDIIRAEQCKSLHDLVCLCMERSLAQIFSFAGKPARGLAGIKQLRLEIPIVMNTFNLGDGLFPSAAEKTSITVEDVRCVPAWSMLLGLACPMVDWTELGMDSGAERTAGSHLSSYAVISQGYMYCTLRLGLQLHVMECRCDDDTSGFVHYQYKGSGGDPWERAQRQRVVRLILEDEGFAVAACGDYLEATRTEEKEVVLQRNLACLGLLAAWLQSCSPDVFVAMNPAEGLARFRELFARFQNRSC